MDRLQWTWRDCCGFLTTNRAYLVIASTQPAEPILWWYRVLWHWNVPKKILCFTWLVLKDKVLTMDNYVRRGGMGPNVCSLCLNDAEFVQHLFVKCHTTLQLWTVISHQRRLDFCWNKVSIADILLYWHK